MAVTKYGEPLAKIEVEEPPLRPGFALLEVLTCGVCFSDVKTARGKMPYSDSLQLPHIPGHEICGKVIATDPAGALPTGTTVVAYHIWPCRRCERCRAGYDNLCTNPVSWTGFTHPGGFRDRLVVPLDRLTVVPDKIDPVHAAPLTCALGTAYRAVVTRGEISAGTRAVVIGLGGVGIHALQIARTTSARVVGLDVSQPPIDAALELGLDARATTMSWMPLSRTGIAMASTLSSTVSVAKRHSCKRIVSSGPVDESLRSDTRWRRASRCRRPVSCSRRSSSSGRATC
jgi:alcohol dehydrogenase